MPRIDAALTRWIIVGVVTALVTLSEPCCANDPRPSADAPYGVEAQPRTSRRAQRRARRRGSLTESLESESEPKTTKPPLLALPAAAAETSLGADLGGVLDQPLVHRDQPSVEGCLPSQRFDIYLPVGCGGNLPLVVWIHGTAWRDGTKDDCPVTWLAGEGYAVASIGYRLSSEATFPAQVDDCLAAITAIERNAAIWGIDPERVCVAGAAAGGHLAALTGLWNGPPAAESLPRVAAIGVFAAPTHLTTLGPEHDRAASPASLLVGGPLPEFREAAQRASPLAHVAPGGPPVLVVHGLRDTTVPPQQSVQFDAALKAAGIDSQLVMLDAAHDLPLDRTSAAGMALLEFLDRTLGPGSRDD
jgi:acetyl esterase/lipase